MVLKLASLRTFERAKRLLDERGYNESGLADPAGEDDPKALLASLFLQGNAVPVERADAVLSPEERSLLEELGLVETAEGAVRARTMLYPLRGLHIASDFPRNGTPDDFVFPAISQQTWEYLRILPETPCKSLLEIGAGSGAASLLAARYAADVVSCDISRRCLHFSEFNRRLNAVEGVRFVASDVYAGLDPELKFERIVSHPPYVPWTGRQEAYRHGGPDGEAVLRRILAGLPERLLPGGRVYLATLGLDTHEAPLEARLREMIGPTGGEYDILVAERQVLAPLEFVLPWREGEDLAFEEAWGLSQALRERGARALVRCSVVIVRHDKPREPLTLRRAASDSTGAAELDREFVRKNWSGDWATLFASRPVLTGEVALESLSLPTDDGWRPQTLVLRSEHPFVFRSDCPDWAAAVLPLCDGRKTLGELLEGADYDPEEAEAFFGCLIDAGVIEV